MVDSSLNRLLHSIFGSRVIVPRERARRQREKERERESACVSGEGVREE